VILNFLSGDFLDLQKLRNVVKAKVEVVLQLCSSCFYFLAADYVSYFIVVDKFGLITAFVTLINLPSRFQDGSHDVISCRKVLPCGECTCTICVAYMQQRCQLSC